MVAIDRLSIAVFLTATLHFFFILTIGFTSPPSAQSQAATHQESIHLSQANDTAPIGSKLLANRNNQGKGHDQTPQEKATNIELGVFNNKGIAYREATEDDKSRTVKPASVVLQKTSPVLYYGLNQELKRLTQDAPKTLSAMDFKIALNTLDTSIERQYYSQKNSAHVLSSSTTLHPAASYVSTWVKRIEKIGNEQYPSAALKKGIVGEVIVVAVITETGKLKKSRVLMSSGENILDQSALRTIRVSAPFQPFDQKLKQTTSTIEIVRTFSYKGVSLTTRPGKLPPS